MRPRPIAIVLLVLGMGSSLSSAAGQTAMDAAVAKAAEATQKEAIDEKLAAQKTVDSSTAMPAPPGDVVLGDATTRQKYLAAMQRYYEYRADGYAYRSRVFEWQLFSSRVIFSVVLVLVAAGIYFAAVQFRTSMVVSRQHAADKAAAGDAQVVSLATQLEVSAKGVVVNSSVLGVIILSLSLAFFYLYLVYVYPIQNVF